MVADHRHGVLAMTGAGDFADAVRAFHDRYPWLDEPEKARDQCYYVARSFGHVCRDLVVPAHLAGGWIVDEDGELIAMHFATVIGETVWDWTFRQFHPDAPVPMVTPLDGWEDAMFGVEHYDLDEEPPGLDESLNDIYRRLATR